LELRGKPWLALAIVAVPHTGEVFLNPTNLQWITALGLILTWVKCDPETAAEWGADGVLLVLAGLTGPFSVLLAPLFTARALIPRTRASWQLVGMVAATTAVQCWFICHAPAFSDPRAWRWANLVGVLAVALPVALAGGEEWPVKPGYAWTAPLGLALMGGLIFLSCRRGGGAARGCCCWRSWLFCGGAGISVFNEGATHAPTAPSERWRGP
jgi:hypothetical protein